MGFITGVYENLFTGVHPKQIYKYAIDNSFVLSWRKELWFCVPILEHEKWPHITSVSLSKDCAVTMATVAKLRNRFPVAV